ncbi:MAG: hypothetical protein ABSD56_02165 [Bryobacteraceae bacterium]|jgi:hypothetical protein
MKGREWWAEYKAYVYVALAVCVLSWMGVHGLRALGVVLLIGGVVVLTGWGKWNKMAQVYLTGPGEVMEPSEREDATMPKHRADAVVTYPGKPMVVVSVATTPSKIVLSFGDGREWHGTYPADGRFHLTEDASSSHSFLEPGPSLSDISYVHVVSVPVPMDPSQLVREFRSSSGNTLLISPPTEREGQVEVGILGQRATPEIMQSLAGPGSAAFFQGPRSDTTIVLRHIP